MINTPKNYHNLGISTVNKYKTHSDVKEDWDMIELDFGPTLNILKEKHLDIYKGIQSEIIHITRFDEHLDLSTTYLRNLDRSKMINLKQKNLFPYQNKGTH